MDWNLAIERNREALKRILAALVAMAGLAGGTAFTSPLWGGRREASGGGGDPAITPTRRSDDRRPPHKGEVRSEFRPTLPRHLHRAVLRLLRPAEAAVRRLVIVAARDVVVSLPQQRPRKPDPKAAHAALRSLGIAIVMPHNLPHPEVRAAGKPRRAEVRALSLPKGEFRRPHARKITLALTDPLRMPRPDRPRYVPAHAAPRILSFDGARPHRLPPPPAPGDPIDATRIALRLQALAAALDDLPKHARRFARWRARRARDAESPSPLWGSEGQARQAARPGKPRGGGNRFVRLSPLRPGRPPGLSAADRRRPAHEVHEVLADLQYFAIKALQPPDTS